VKLKSKTVWFLAPLIFAGIYLFFFHAGYPEWHNLERLAFAGVHTNGQVSAKEPGNHQSIRYEFSVGTNNYSGVGNADHGGLPGLDRIGVGEIIPVTYLPDQPEISVPGDPIELFHSWSFLLFLMLPAMSLIATVVTVRRLLKNST
jgi:hypothetical protein